MKMIDNIGRAAMLEQFAEEATELAHAALKMARVERGENPTPVTWGEANQSLIEEYTDTVTCAKELGIEFNEDIANVKYERFKNRWNNKKS